jgi:hypothetical protein
VIRGERRRKEKGKGVERRRKEKGKGVERRRKEKVGERRKE